MAFNNLTTGDIAVGEPVTRDKLLKVKDSLEDLDTRLTSVEQVGQKIVIYNEVYIGLHQYAGIGSDVSLDVFTAPFAFTITDAQIIQYDAGTAGTFEIDVKVGSSFGSTSTIFSTRPSLAFGDAEDTYSSNQVISSGSVSENDFIELVLKNIQTAQGTVGIYVIGEP